MKDKKEISDLVEACKEVLQISKEHSYLWNDPSLWDKDDKEKQLVLFGGFIAQDEYHTISLAKNKSQFGFRGSDFCENELITDLTKAALYFDRRNISAENLRNSYYLQLKKPLGRYLANQYLENKKRGKNV